jgi:hypothetical protein
VCAQPGYSLPLSPTKRPVLRLTRWIPEQATQRAPSRRCRSSSAPDESVDNAGDILPKLAVSWVEAEAAARFAAAKPREWIEHNTHSLMLRQAGRHMLSEQVGPDGGVEGGRQSESI